MLSLSAWQTANKSLRRRRPAGHAGRLSRKRLDCARPRAMRSTEDTNVQSSRSNGPALNRRELLRLSTAAGVGAVMPTYGAFADTTRGPSVASGDVQHASFGRRDHAVRQRARLCRGRRVHVQGGAYGASTGGENRWLPAKPPTPWDGEYPALIYGANCPQRLHDWVSDRHFSSSGRTAGRARTCSR